LKNVLVLAAPGAAGMLTHERPLLRTLAAVAIFCVVASGTYLLNDSLDAEADRHHPVKRHRPIASGIVPVRVGLTVGIILLASYVAVQFAYSYRLKHEPIFDLACVAAGFVLRAIAGGVAAQVPISEWFLIVAMFGSLIMVTGKRFAEHTELGDARGAHRATLSAYSEAFLRGVLLIASAVTVTAYCEWAFQKQAQLPLHQDPIWFQLSIVPFVLAILRYGYMVDTGHGGQPEEVVLSDRALQIVAVIWVGIFALGVYAS
jgi:decaprenyl-phosphate phosphoribosyltransferase